MVAEEGECSAFRVLDVCACDRWVADVVVLLLLVAAEHITRAGKLKIAAKRRVLDSKQFREYTDASHN